MILIIDSGSTKADWVFTDGRKTHALSTEGMNPNFIGEEEILRIISTGIPKYITASDVKKIFYFGTGCSGPEQKKLVSGAFKKIFVNAKVNVDHDISGAVIATCGNEKGIACIIGTGSNSVYFDGEKIHENNYGLGYILGDEGAGTYLGKKLVTLFLYGLLPGKLAEEFKLTYNLTREEVIKIVYSNPTANTWLASFAHFLDSHKQDVWVRSTVKQGFEEFIGLFVMNYKDYKILPVHFVGSIAFHYKDILDEIVKEKKIILGKVIQKPIDGLAEYFIKQNFKQVI